MAQFYFTGVDLDVLKGRGLNFIYICIYIYIYVYSKIGTNLYEEFTFIG